MSLSLSLSLSLPGGAVGCRMSATCRRLVTTTGSSIHPSIHPTYPGAVWVRSVWWGCLPGGGPRQRRGCLEMALAVPSLVNFLEWSLETIPWNPILPCPLSRVWSSSRRSCPVLPRVGIQDYHKTNPLACLTTNPPKQGETSSRTWACLPLGDKRTHKRPRMYVPHVFTPVRRPSLPTKATTATRNKVTIIIIITPHRFRLIWWYIYEC